MLKRNEDYDSIRQRDRVRPPGGFTEQEWDALNRLRRVRRPSPRWLPSAAAAGLAATLAIGAAIYLSRTGSPPAAQSAAPRITVAEAPVPPAQPEQAHNPTAALPRSEPPSLAPPPPDPALETPIPPVGGPLVPLAPAEARQAAADPAPPRPAAAPQERLRQAMPAQEADALIARAEKLLRAHRDVVGARLFLQRAEQGGSARAAYLLAETFDPAWLQSLGARGVRPDSARARALYEQALAGGDKDARARLEALR